MRKQTRNIAIVLCSVVLGSAAAVTAAESPGDATGANDPERQRAFEVYREHEMPEAAALLEKVVARDPTDVAAHEALGVALVSRAATESSPEKAQADRLYGRKELLRATELGDKSDLCRILLAQVPESGEVPALSEKADVNSLLQAGEAAFAAADWQKALAAYSDAWDRDHTGTAALYVGDTYFSLKDMDRAGEWYAKAIELEPNRETAYRYWGDALMAQGKMKEARAKYIDGVVADPYEATSVAGLRKWLTKNKLEFKKLPITLPPGPSVGKDGKTTINVDASMLDKSDVAAAWLAYSAVRGQWQEGQFLKTFPQEISYRHSLAEEVAALGSVVLVYRELTGEKARKKDASLELLEKFTDDGLVEPFVLLAHADAGIAKDYSAYRDAHREKLATFLDQYLVPSAR
jgi:tetratricopeptide (TPR) repeat protein